MNAKLLNIFFSVRGGSTARLERECWNELSGSHLGSSARLHRKAWLVGVKGPGGGRVDPHHPPQHKEIVRRHQRHDTNRRHRNMEAIGVVGSTPPPTHTVLGVELLVEPFRLQSDSLDIPDPTPPPRGVAGQADRQTRPAGIRGSLPKKNGRTFIPTSGGYAMCIGDGVVPDPPS